MHARTHTLTHSLTQFSRNAGFPDWARQETGSALSSFSLSRDSDGLLSSSGQQSTSRAMSDAFDDDQSMASWAREDDVDLQAAAVVGSKLSEIDGILFNEIAMRSDDIDKHIMTECLEWKAR